jgi:hypothetical protein
MEGSVLSFLKAEWKVSDTGSAHWASSLVDFFMSMFFFKCQWFRSVEGFQYFLSLPVLHYLHAVLCSYEKIQWQHWYFYWIYIHIWTLICSDSCLFYDLICVYKVDLLWGEHARYFPCPTFRSFYLLILTHLHPK